MTQETATAEVEREVTRPPVLDVENLTKHYVESTFLGRERERVRAVDGVSFELRTGETLGLVGESGCGKSTVARTLLRLEEPTAGEVRFDGTALADHSRRDRREFRRRTGVVFQDPTSSFDPRMTVGRSVAEPLRVHGLPPERHRPVVTDLLERVGLSADDHDRYPHEFSGGQKQRLALARALVTNPDLLVADEPVSALDVSVQAGVLGLLDDVQASFDLSVLLITHDMGVVRQVCDRVAVMYLGEIVEVAPTEALFADPRHPYTEALLDAVPDVDPTSRGETTELRGDVPDPADPPAGCRFHTRCPAVVPPEGLDVDQAAFRRVMDLRVALREDSVDLTAIRSRVADAGDVDESDVGPESLASGLRRTYEIPPLGDESAESTLDLALTEIATGDRERARERLAGEFASPCERERPVETRTADRRVRCHLWSD